MFGRDKRSPRIGSAVTILDMGTTKFTCMIGEWIEGEVPDDNRPLGAVLRIIGYGQSRAMGMKAGVLTDLDAGESAVRDVVAQAEMMAGQQAQNVIVAVSCGRLKSMNFTTQVSLEGGAVRQSHINEVMLAGRDHAADEGRAVLHLIPMEFALDDATGIVDPTNMVGDILELDLHAVTADVSPLKNIALLLDKCHLHTSRMMATPYASALAVADESEIALGTTVIDIGGGTTKLALFAGGHFVHSDAIAVGGDLITFEIAQALNCPISEAERLKILHGSVYGASGEEGENKQKRAVNYSIVGDGHMGEGQITSEQLSDVIRPRVHHILSLVMDRLNNSGFGAHSGHRWILTGGCSQLNGLAEFACEIFGKPVRLGEPQAIQALPPEMVGPSFSSAIGLFQALRRYDLADSQFLGVGKSRGGSGYWSRVGAWLKESF